jgi:hypothetical protein
MTGMAAMLKRDAEFRRVAMDIPHSTLRIRDEDSDGLRAKRGIAPHDGRQAVPPIRKPLGSPDCKLSGFGISVNAKAFVL